jgi:hypothetical protein
MASPLIPILVIVAVGAAVLLTKKKDREDKLETTRRSQAGAAGRRTRGCENAFFSAHAVPEGLGRTLLR